MDTTFYKIVRPIVKGLFYFLYKPEVIGKENILDDGPIVLAGNHTKWLDAIMLISVSNRQVHFLAKDELFHGLFKFVMKGMGAIPVNRRIHDHGALDSAIDMLKNNSCIGIFPEGTINRTNDVVMPFKIGAVKMSNATNAKLIPFVISGEYKLFRRSVRIEFLKAHKVSDNLDKENKKLMEDISKVLIRR